MPNVIFQRFESFLSFNRYRYLWVALALMVVAIGCYVFAPVKTEHNGGTWFGYTLGVISVGLMVWLAALGLRKRLIRPGKWSQKGRTSAHVYLGIALALVATLHTGFQFGWNVHTAAFGGMMIVIVSGFIGVAIYVTVPSKLSENAGSQTFVELKSQLDQVNLQLDKVLFELDGPPLKLGERVLKTDGVLVSQLRALFSQVALPVFEQFRDSIQQARDAGAIERDLSLTVLRLTQSKAALVKRIRLHQRYKALISIWLAVHVPFTFFSMLLVGIHIFAVFYYW